MTRDDIIRMAGEVGIQFDPRWGTCYTGNTQLERFAAMVAAAEREAILKLTDSLGWVNSDDIRARGEV